MRHVLHTNCLPQKYGTLPKAACARLKTMFRYKSASSETSLEALMPFSMVMIQRIIPSMFYHDASRLLRLVTNEKVLRPFADISSMSASSILSCLPALRYPDIANVSRNYKPLEADRTPCIQSIHHSSSRN